MGVLLLTDVLPFLQHQSSDQHVEELQACFWIVKQSQTTACNGS